MGKKVRIIFAISGIVPLLSLLNKPPDPTLLIYSLFVLIYFLRDFILKILNKVTFLPVPAKFLILTIIAGLIAEIFAWYGNFVKCDPKPALLHPQLFPDLIAGVGLYFSWAIAWIILFKRFRFSLLQAFIVQGIYGVFVEQYGAIFIQGLISMPIGLLFWLYVFLVYGSITGISYALVGNELTHYRQKESRLKYLLALILLLASSFAISAIWGVITKVLGLIPEQKPICGNPFW